jgi:hypothetical protein
MFVAGVAMAFSIGKQKLSLTWNQRFVRILKRCGWLFFWGVLDYAVRKNGLTFELWDVLTQLSFTTWLLSDHGMAGGMAGCKRAILLIPELLYRFTVFSLISPLRINIISEIILI